MTGRFEGKVVLVTGSASGIGWAASRAFASEGASVMLADLNAAAAEAKAAELRAAGSHAASFAVDVADPGACEAMTARTVETFGGLHIAFNNAGIASSLEMVEDCAIEDWRRIIDVNLMGIYHCLRAEIPAMKACGGSAIINTASVASFIASAGMSAYVVSKHGVAGLTKAVALELIDHGIRVNAVCPGFTHTGMLDPAEMPPEMVAKMKLMTPIGRVACADEVAKAVLFLASEESSYIMGSLLNVDGGVLLQ